MNKLHLFYILISVSIFFICVYFLKNKNKNKNKFYDFNYVRDKVDSLFMIHKLREKKSHDKTFESIKKFYINLDRNEERREDMEKEFQLYGMKNYERVPACDSKMVTSTYEGDFGDVKYINGIGNYKLNTNTKTELAITCSHLKTIKKAYLEKLKYAIIMEDDARFTLMPHWDQTFKNILDSLPIDCDVLLLTTSNVNHKSKKTFISNKEQGFTSAVCYLITQKGMEKVNNIFFRDETIFFDKNIKTWVRNQIDTTVWKNLNVYHLQKQLFTLYDFKTDSHFEFKKGIDVEKDLKILKDYYI